MQNFVAYGSKKLRCDNSAMHLENNVLDRQISEELENLSLKCHRLQADRNFEIKIARMRLNEHRERVNIIKSMRAASAPFPLHHKKHQQRRIASNLPGGGIQRLSSARDVKRTTYDKINIFAGTSVRQRSEAKLDVISKVCQSGAKSADSDDDGGGDNDDDGADGCEGNEEEMKDGRGESSGEQAIIGEQPISHRILPLRRLNRDTQIARSRRQMGDELGLSPGRRPQTTTHATQGFRRKRLMTLGQMLHINDGAMTVQQLRQTCEIDVCVEEERESRRRLALDRRQLADAKQTAQLLQRLRLFCETLDKMKQQQLSLQ